MTLRIAKFRNASLLAAFVATLAFAMAASSAAHAYEYAAHNLAGKTWTCGSCEVGSLWWENAQATTSSSICVGPVTHNSEGFHAPYGWKCNPKEVEWNFATISASPGTYNPNAGSIEWVYVHFV
jgi:hypothetical protein